MMPVRRVCVPGCRVSVSARGEGGRDTRRTEQKEMTGKGRTQDKEAHDSQQEDAGDEREVQGMERELQLEGGVGTRRARFGHVAPTAGGGSVEVSGRAMSCLATGIQGRTGTAQ